VEFERTITKRTIEGIGSKVGEQVDLFNSRQVERQLGAVLPVDVRASFGATGEEIAAFTREGVDRITTMSSAYFDEVQAEGQINPIAGLGYQDEDGKWMPTMRLFGYRELWKRLYTLMQDRGFQEPVIILHNTSTTYAGPMAFATATWDFEEANTDPDQRQLTKFGINYLITEAMGHQYGFAASTLGPSPGFERWIKPGDVASEHHAARHWMGVHIVLDMNPYLRAHPVLEEALGMLGAFGWNKPGTEWLPYWKGEKEGLFTLQPGADERHYATLYRRGSEGLLILLNDTNQDADLRWKPGKALEVKGGLREINPGSATVQPEEGGYRITVPRYDYRAFHMNLD